jgi:hypothetical protein
VTSERTLFVQFTALTEQRMFGTSRTWDTGQHFTIISHELIYANTENRANVHGLYSMQGLDIVPRNWNILNCISRSHLKHLLLSDDLLDRLVFCCLEQPRSQDSTSYPGSYDLRSRCSPALFVVAGAEIIRPWVRGCPGFSLETPMTSHHS